MMGGMGGMMDGVSGGGFVVELLLVGLVVLWSALLFGAGYVAARRRPPTGEDASLSLLRRRLASGEIDDDQYLRLLSTMEHG